MRLTGTWPAGLESAFHRYEDALMQDDTAVLDALFEPGPDTLRGDGAGLLRGHSQISAFRSARGGVARRALIGVDVQVLGPDAVLVVGESRFLDGGRGLQTQLWCRTDGTWRIRTAHVTGRAPAFDRSVWRVLGDPLVPGAGSGPGGASGPLAGVRVAVKDLIAVRGQVIGAGNPTWQAQADIEDEHAPAVAMLLDAGAEVTGIARSDEFAYGLAGRNAHSGTTPNGAAPRRIGGGSTSGSASAVALGQADLGLGTDTAGSLRVPASYQGLWGLRTTHGAVSRTGVLPLAQTFDTVGWLTRDPELLRQVVGIAFGDPVERQREAEDPLVRGEPLLLSDALLDAAEPDTRSAFLAWVELVGRPVQSVALPDLDDLAETLRVVQAAEAHRNHGDWVAAHPGALGADVAERFAAAAAVTAEQESAARARLVELRTVLRRVVGNGVLAFPTAPGPAPDRTADTAAVLVTRRATLRMTSVAGVGGLPAVSFPALRVDDAPVGVCLVGPAGADLALVDLAIDLSTTPATRS
ncbi:Asp-tRNA(Asn)/Glu-tRNA(Gln) amidotransferase A subunit family amidase [Curtobacterium herbarum]|uniref:AtzH-like domain-containing protein n=1 Tax=Curtobacterium herbarum TaxID=150122 RepID=UPI00209FE31A|nr:AtzH-like domain-containing protein [Curtobacterium herbarum]MCP1502683.1 Asp-tRNA(Asn)/Glu-tRNA(Gln) amidotransferase A subunit family amidase [Curtobacterium herbarum]